jgi:AraC-like DNA-binding protein
MFYWPFSNWLAVGPTLYFYFRSLTNQEFRLQRQHWWHFVPALAFGAWLLVVFGYDIGWWHGLQGRPLPAHFGTKGPLASWADYQPIGLLADTLGYLSVLAYALHTLRAYRVYARYLNDNFSDTEQLRFRWLHNVLVAVVVGTGVTLAFGVINFFVTPLNYVQSWYDYLFTGLLIYYLSISGLLTGYRLAALRFQLPADTAAPPAPMLPTVEAATGAPGNVALETSEKTTATAVLSPPEIHVSDAVVAASAPLVVDNTVEEPTETAAEPDAELARWMARLLAHMQAARPYLEPELTLGELATQLRTNTSWLSKVINSGCGQNFNDFINEYRVREAERCLRDPQFRHYTLLAVALKAGFNSKSTFNRVFKKLRGQTPSEAARQL